MAHSFNILKVVPLHQLFNILTAMIAFVYGHSTEHGPRAQSQHHEGCRALLNYVVLADNNLQPGPNHTIPTLLERDDAVNTRA